MFFLFCVCVKQICFITVSTTFLRLILFRVYVCVCVCVLLILTQTRFEQICDLSWNCHIRIYALLQRQIKEQ